MAIIYARQSKDRKGDEAAVDRQLDACRALAERLSLGVDAELVDNDVSASKGTRPAFERLLQAVRDGKTDTVLVWATDRLYRRLTDLVSLVELAEKHSLRILTVKSGDLDLSTPAGRMLAGMLGSAARFEVEQKGVRQVEANGQRARRGQWQFTRRPFGYRRDEAGNVVVVQEEAEVLREGYRRSLAGESGYAIVADWNARGVLAPSGGTWTITQLRERLANPHYAGLVVHRGEIVGDGLHEPLVDRDDWERVVQAIKHRSARRSHDNRTKYLLSGILRCGVCGGQIFARPEYRRAGGKIMTYQCTTGWCVSRRLDPIDDLVRRLVLARLARPDARDLIAPQQDTGPLIDEAHELHQRLATLAELVADGTLPAPPAREQSARLRSRIEALNAQIGAQETSALAAMLTADDLPAAWTALDLDQRRGLVRSLFDNLSLDRQANPRVFDPDALRYAWKSAAALAASEVDATLTASPSGDASALAAALDPRPSDKTIGQLS